MTTTRGHPTPLEITKPSQLLEPPAWAGQTKTVYVWAIDNLTNRTASAASDSIIITDADPDNVTVVLADNATINSTSADSVTDNITVLITANDNFVVKSYYIATSPDVIPSYTAGGWVNFSNPQPTVSENATFNLSGVTLSDNINLYVWLQDNATNVTDNYTTDSIVLIDNGTPTISSVVAASTGGSTSKLTGNTANVTIVASDLFEVDSYHITDNGSYVPSPDNNSLWDNFTARQSTSVVKLSQPLSTIVVCQTTTFSHSTSG